MLSCCIRDGNIAIEVKHVQLHFPHLKYSAVLCVHQKGKVVFDQCDVTGPSVRLQDGASGTCTHMSGWTIGQTKLRTAVVGAWVCRLQIIIHIALSNTVTNTALVLLTIQQPYSTSAIHNPYNS